MPDQNGNGKNGNGKNGAVMKAVISVLAALVLAGIVGGVHMYRQLGIIEDRVSNNSDMVRQIEDIRREAREAKALAENINADRHARGPVIQRLAEDLADLRRRLEPLERRR